MVEHGTIDESDLDWLFRTDDAYEASAHIARVAGVSI